jgi:hypothetical protein
MAGPDEGRGVRIPRVARRRRSGVSSHKINSRGSRPIIRACAGKARGREPGKVRGREPGKHVSLAGADADADADADAGRRTRRHQGTRTTSAGRRDEQIATPLGLMPYAPIIDIMSSRWQITAAANSPCMPLVVDFDLLERRSTGNGPHGSWRAEQRHVGGFTRQVLVDDEFGPARVGVGQHHLEGAVLFRCERLIRASVVE